MSTSDEATKRRSDEGRLSTPRGIVASWLCGSVCCFLPLASLPCLPSAAAAGEARPADFDASGPDANEVEARIEKLNDRVAALVDDADLLDTLHFAWLDRPYARTTLAVLVKTNRAFQRELRMRGHGHGAIRDADLARMLAWAEEAVDRACQAPVDPRFRPHRLRVTPEHLLTAPRLPPLFTYLDASRLTRRDDRFGDLDLLAAMGFRIYATREEALVQTMDGRLTGERATWLGMSVAAVSHDGTDPAATQLEGVVTIRPATLKDLLAQRPEAVALLDPRRSESPSARLARRGLARGATGRQRFFVVNWGAPQPGAAVAAAMWVDAIEGLTLGVLPGWRDLRDGSSDPHPSMLTDPAGTEDVAHTALDLIRLADVVRTFDTPSPVAVVVGADAVNARDDNAWADWTEPIWTALSDQQLRFDVMPAAAPSAELARRYQVVLPVDQADSADREAFAVRVQRALASAGSARAPVAIESSGGAPSGSLYARRTHGADGQSCIALVNLSDKRRVVMLSGDVPLGEAGVMYGGLANKPVTIAGSSTMQAARIALAPWQVLLLAPDTP